MSKNLTILFFLSFSLSAFGQFLPNSGQPFQLMSSYNPAASGIDDFVDIKILHRNQWTAFKDAPQYTYLALNGRLKRPLDIMDQGIRLSQSALEEQANLPRRKLILVGGGAQIFQETFGPISRTGGLLSLSLHYPLSRKVFLSLGISGVLDKIQFSLSKIKLAEDDPFYDLLLSSGANFANFNLRGGFLFYGEKFYFGGSYLPIVHSTIGESGISNDYISNKATVSAGVVIGNKEVMVKPSILALIDGQEELLIDYNVKMYLGDKIWWGATYRDVKSLVIILGMNINPLIGVSYSYEKSIGGFSQFDRGSHDLVLSLRLGNYNNRVNSYIW